MKAKLLLIATLLPHLALAEQTLTLDEYVKSVASQNGNYKAAAYLAKSFELRAGEASLEFMPQLTGSATYTDNRLTPSSPFGSPTNITWNGSLGVSTKLRTGTQVSLSYANNYYNISTSPFGIAAYTFFIDGPAVSITQPLWKDFWAASSKANEDLQLASFKAQYLQQQYMLQSIRFNAETAYWRLALFREIVNFDKQSLERTQKILKWNQRRVAMNVADRADLLQAQAALKLKQLQLQSDLEQLRQVSAAFNSMRNVLGDQVTENLTHIDTALHGKIATQLKKTADRLDVQALLQNAVATKAQADANREKVKPTVNITGTAQFSGKDTQMGTAVSNSWNANNPLYSVGLTLSVPLDFGTVSDINEGNRAAAMASQYQAERAKFDLEQDWNELKKKYADVITRFEMAQALESLQKEKLEHERTRFNSGRTTSFQVLQFEDNYSDAILTRLRIENDAITLRAQARLFNGGISAGETL